MQKLDKNQAPQAGSPQAIQLRMAICVHLRRYYRPEGVAFGPAASALQADAVPPPRLTGRLSWSRMPVSWVGHHLFVHPADSMQVPTFARVPDLYR